MGQQFDSISGMCFDICLTIVYCRATLRQQPFSSENVSDLHGDNHIIVHVLPQITTVLNFQK